MSRIKTFFSLNYAAKILLIEAWLQLGRAWVVKKLPFSRIAPSLGNIGKETSFQLNETSRKALNDVSLSIQTMSRFTFWDSQCLVKAIAAMKMLEKRNIDCTLYLGTAKDDNGKLMAHAWLRSGPFYITGKEEMKKFTVVNQFAKIVKGEGINNG